MTDTIRIYCAEPGRVHGSVNPRRQQIETFRKVGNWWQTVPPPRSRVPTGKSSEILHRTSEVAVTTDGFAVGYAFKYAPLGPRRWRRAPALTEQGRAVMRVAIDLRNGTAMQAEQGDDYTIDHVTYEMNCRCGSQADLSKSLLMLILDAVASSGEPPELSLEQLRTFIRRSQQLS